MKTTFAALSLVAALMFCASAVRADAAPEEAPSPERWLKDRLESIRKDFPEADADENGELSMEELTAFYRKRDQELRQRIGAATALEDLPDDYAVERDVVYGEGDNARYQKLDIVYHRDTSQRRPAIVMLHGGGFRQGNKAAFHTLMRDYALEGYVTLSVAYRFTQVAPFPAQVEDCKLAVRWLRAHAEKYGVDPDRIGVMGASAGGYLAAMLAFTDEADGMEGDGPYRDQSSRVQAAAPLCAIYDLRPAALHRASPDESGWKVFLGTAPSDDPELAARASPIAHVSKEAPPILLVHARDDIAAPVYFAQDLADALDRAGVPCELHLVKGTAHGWSLPYEEDVPQHLREFFARHLKGESGAPR